MSQISRLREAEIANGNLINADDIDAELNQLVTESNGQDTRLTNLETGAMTIAGAKTFSSPLKVDQINERSTDNGVTIETVVLKDGSIKLASNPGFHATINGEMGYDSTDHVYRLMVNNSPKYLIHEGNPVVYKGGVSGAPPVYTSASSITLKSGLRARNSSNATDIELAADVVLSFATSGLGGLDTGTKTNNTWYYVYLVKRNLDNVTGAVFSAANEAAGGIITLPVSYDMKRQLPLAVKVDASGNIIPFYISSGWPYRTTVLYRVPILPVNSTPATGQPNVLDGGTATTYTDVSLAAYVPPIAMQAILKGGIYQVSASGKFGYIRKKGSSTDEFVIQNGSGRTITDYDWEIVETDSSQVVQYRMTDTTSAMDINVQGYIVTEVN